MSLIKQAKKKGINITASVSPQNLLLDDTYTLEYDSSFKVSPPLRSKNDIKALVKGLNDGTIDVVCSQHMPHDEESKNLEFEYAQFGVSSIDTAYTALNTAMGDGAEQSKIVEYLSINPRNILGLDPVSINEGSKAELSLFDPNEKWTPTEADIKSKSKNSPYIGMELKGRVIGIVNNDQISINE